MDNQDNMDPQEPVNELRPYTLEELTFLKLPQKLAEHSNEVQLEQGKEHYEQTINNLVDVARELNVHMDDEVYAFTGSMSMYALWSNLMEERPDIDIRGVLNQRVTGGKNDFDIAISEARKEVVMTEKLKFDHEAKTKQRGVIGNHMVDIQVRPVMKDFPYKEVRLGDQRVLVQNPVVGIFERMSALAYPQIGDDGKENPKEVKWGVDTKLLKLYIMLSENLTEDQLEERLKNLWDRYQEGKRYEYPEYLASQVKLGKDPKELLLPSMRKLLNGKVSIEDLEEKIKGVFSDVPSEVINKMLYTRDEEVFLQNIKEIIDLVTQKPDSYEEMNKKANENYSGILLG